MLHFTSQKEKRYWVYSIFVAFIIFLTLLLGQPLLGKLGNQNAHAAIFVLCMVLIGSAIIIHGLKKRTGKTELATWLGLAALFIMFFLRLGLAERSHLMEYSVLTIFIHKAITERMKRKGGIYIPALLTFIVAFSIGIVDEVLQIFIPYRVFDYYDILFNAFAVFAVIATRIILSWMRERLI